MRALAPTGLAGLILLPLLRAVIFSFAATLPRDGIAAGTGGLMNRRAVFAAPELRAAMVISCVSVSLNVGLGIAVCLPAAHAPAWFRLVGDRLFLRAILVFRMMPTGVPSLPVFILLSQFGLVHSPVGIALEQACSTCRS